MNWKIERELVVAEIKKAKHYDQVSLLVKLRAELVMINSRINGVDKCIELN